MGGQFVDSSAAADWTGRRVLLTGASGFVGAQVAKQGLAAGVELICLGRNPGPDGSTLLQADLADAAAVARAVVAARPHAVIHCAAPGVVPGSAGFAEMLAVAQSGTRALYAACAALRDPPRVVHVGSGFEFAAAGHPVDEDWPRQPAPGSYGAAKVAAAAVAETFAAHLPLAILRPFHIYGAGEAPGRLGPFLVREALAGRPIGLTGCEQRRDFLHVDDCAAWLWHGLGLTGSFNLGSGVPIGLRDFVDAVMAELAGCGIAGDCRFGAVPYRKGEPMISLPDTSRWRAVCTRLPLISLEAGIADLVQAELARCR